MKFWKQLRLVGIVIVLGIAALAVVLTVLRTPDAGSGPPAGNSPVPLNASSGTTGL